MRLFYLFLILILPVDLFGDGPKKLTVTGATWMGHSGEANNPNRTDVIEADEEGRITRVYDLKNQNSAMLISYADHKVELSMGGGAEVKIDARMEWAPQEGGGIQIDYSQQNDVPESVVLGKKYPRKISKKSFTIMLTILKPSEYSWKEIRGESWLIEDGRSQYRCVVGKQVVWDRFDEKGALEYRTILDGHTSDASPQTTAKMFYTKTRNSVVGKYYWTMEPEAFDERTWNKGGRIEYSGDSLNTKDTLVNVVNYYLLRVWFASDAWHYFGPSLFGIPIR